MGRGATALETLSADVLLEQVDLGADRGHEDHESWQPAAEGCEVHPVSLWRRWSSLAWSPGSGAELDEEVFDADAAVQLGAGEQLGVRVAGALDAGVVGAAEHRDGFPADLLGRQLFVGDFDDREARFKAAGPGEHLVAVGCLLVLAPQVERVGVAVEACVVEELVGGAALASSGFQVVAGEFVADGAGLAEFIDELRDVAGDVSRGSDALELDTDTALEGAVAGGGEASSPFVFVVGDQLG